MVTLRHERGRGKSDFYDVDEMVCCQLSNGGEARFVIDPERYLGCGGNAIVYQCSNAVTGEQCAIKIQVVNNPERQARFKREVQLLTDVHHDQLMTGIASGSMQLETKENGERLCPFAIMSLADTNLNDLIRLNSTALSEELLWGQYRGLSGALAVLHTKAIHRDIKPQNILVRGDNWILADYGLCKFLDDEGPEVTIEGEKIGPRYWMSPESMNRIIGNRDEISKASDVFQLASVFWFAATKRHPTGIVKSSDWHGPPKIFEVLESALSHDPQSRPQDGREFHERIEEALF